MKILIKTPCGDIRGAACQRPGVIAFKGIRYARAGRFEYPRLVTAWDGVYDALEYGNCSYQPRAFHNEAKTPEKAFYYEEFRKGEIYTYSEDCLFLNIWTPADASEESRLPVIVYIHGGGFTGGCGHEKHFDGPVWPEKGVIGVTLNYRLGPLGFACLPELKEEAGHTGNYGLYDQLAAIQWVKANIRAFGGDPENITVMGQSAGAMSVQQHCVSPLTEGLFAKAVMSSGGGVSPAFDRKTAPEANYEFWRKVMELADCRTLEEFRKIDAEILFAAWEAAGPEHPENLMACAPCVDGVYITHSLTEALDSQRQRNIPYMLGSTSHDMAPPVLFQMARDWCAEQAIQGKRKSYAWLFDRMLPGDERGAWHSSDLWYWFGTWKNCWRPFTAHDEMLSDVMTDYLCNFAKNGDPNGEGLPEWRAVTDKAGQVLRWGEGEIRMGDVDMEWLREISSSNMR